MAFGEQGRCVAVVVGHSRAAAACAALLLASFACAAGQEAEGGADVIERERASLSALFRRLETAFLNQDRDALGRLLSPRLGEAERRHLMKRQEREFDAVTYREFRIDDDGLGVLEGPITTPNVVMYHVLVPCRYRFETKKEGLGSKVGVNDQAQRFLIEYITPAAAGRTGGNWYISSSSLLDSMGLFNPALHLGTIVFTAVLASGCVIFWLLAVYYCYRRTASAKKALLLFLTTPVGAAVYFFRIMLSPPGE